MRLGELVVIVTKNQRLVRRSHTTRGSDGVPPLRTEVKKVLEDTSRAPSVPPLSKTRTRPFRHTMTWVGLTSPMVSGGMKPESDNVAPRKLMSITWGLRDA